MSELQGASRVAPVHPGINACPDEVLAGILAGVPLGKGKVKMQTVSKQWERVLHMKEAHSLKTRNSDEDMPAAPNILSSRGSSKVSQALLDALVCYKARHSESSDMLFPPRQVDALCVKQTPKICPILPNLRKYACYSPSELPLSPRFPGLREVTIMCAKEADNRKVPAALEALKGLKLLSWVRVRAWSFANLPSSLPFMCTVKFELITKGSPLGVVPIGLRWHLTDVVIHCKGISEEALGGKLDLGVFSHCSRLRNIEVIVGSFEGWERVWVGGLATVPAICKSIAVTRDFDNPSDEELPLVRLCSGWVMGVEWVGGRRGLKLTRVSSSV